MCWLAGRGVRQSLQAQNYRLRIRSCQGISWLYQCKSFPFVFINLKHGMTPVRVFVGRLWKAPGINFAEKMYSGPLVNVDGRYPEPIVLLDAAVGTKGLCSVSRPGTGSDFVSWWSPTCDGVKMGETRPLGSSPAFPKRVARPRYWNSAV